MANGKATMTEIWRYFAGNSITDVPATLSADQKKGYRLADFRMDWEKLTELDRSQLAVGIGDGSFTY